MGSRNSDESVDDRLDALADQVDELRDSGRYRSALRLAEESRRLAQAERRLIPYLIANFSIMNLTQWTLEPEAGREAALQSIALLESPERARRFQADYPEDHYEFTVGWMSACSYDNLAIATARMNGYNSHGMQALIGDGIHVCQRTGKLECVTCFREYATDVHRSADDLEMALHHARTTAERPDPEHDRRWVGAEKVSQILMLQGRLGAAWESALRALELVPTYHSVHSAAVDTRTLLGTLACLIGDKRANPAAAPSGSGSTPTLDEAPEHAMNADMVAAAEAAIAGRYSQAIESLGEWDRRLLAQRCLQEWFGVRLQLIATLRMAGQIDKARARARQLESKAQEACDYLTLRRLGVCLDPALPACPIPPAAPYDIGPFASASATAPAASVAMAAAAAPSPTKTARDNPGPLRPLIDGFMQRIIAANDDSQAAAAIVDELLRIDPASVASEDDGGRLIHALSLVVEHSPREAEAWAWTQAMADRFPDNGPALSLKANVAMTLRSREGSSLADSLAEDQLRAWFRRSTDLTPDGVGTFTRAAQFYISIGDVGEGERCLARAFRLDRANGGIAMMLARFYASTDRQPDALAVLDMCIREGQPDPRLLWAAGTLAVSLERYQAALAYLDAHRELAPDEPWIQYYRALSLLGLSRPEEAGQAIELEAVRTTGPGLHIAAVRAAVAAALKQTRTLQGQIGRIVQIPLYQIEDLAPDGIIQNLARAWDATATLDPSDPLRARLRDWLLQTAMAPDALLESIRQEGKKRKDLSHFFCRLRQPLDERWADWPGRLAGQEGWQEYSITYGVLAAGEEEARRAALKMQERCYPLPATIEEIRCVAEGYCDCPGVTVQSLPEPPE